MRQIIAPLAVASALLATACSSGPAPIKGTDLAASVTQTALSTQSLTISALTCPDITPSAGAVATCMGRMGTKPIKLRVTFTDDQGNYTVAQVNG